MPVNVAEDRLASSAESASPAAVDWHAACMLVRGPSVEPIDLTDEAELVAAAAAAESAAERSGGVHHTPMTLHCVQEEGCRHVEGCCHLEGNCLKGQTDVRQLVGHHLSKECAVDGVDLVALNALLECAAVMQNQRLSQHHCCGAM